ncbi:MAG: glycosyltransferase, partial [Lactovum sp.]
FLSDYLRAKILYEEGGVYLDADMKVIKFIEGMFSGKSLVLAFENNTTLSMGFAAAAPKNKFFRDLKAIYESTTTGKTIMGNVI